MFFLFLLFLSFSEPKGNENTYEKQDAKQFLSNNYNIANNKLSSFKNHIKNVTNSEIPQESNRIMENNAGTNEKNEEKDEMPKRKTTNFNDLNAELKRKDKKIKRGSYSIENLDDTPRSQFRRKLKRLAIVNEKASIEKDESKLDTNKKSVKSAEDAKENEKREEEKKEDKEDEKKEDEKDEKKEDKEDEKNEGKDEEKKDEKKDDEKKLEKEEEKKEEEKQEEKKKDKDEKKEDKEIYFRLPFQIS